MNKKIRKENEGFTLIEILVVIGIVAILATIAVVAINPARQFAQARNTERVAHINTILNAIGQRATDNKGLFPTGTGCATALATTTIYTIGLGSGSFVAPATALIDMSCLVPTYIAQMPIDPNGGVWTDSTHYNTQYNISVNDLGRYTISAPNSKEASLPDSTIVSVTR